MLAVFTRNKANLYFDFSGPVSGEGIHFIRESPNGANFEIVLKGIVCSAEEIWCLGKSFGPCRRFYFIGSWARLSR